MGRILKSIFKCGHSLFPELILCFTFGHDSLALGLTALVCLFVSLAYGTDKQDLILCSVQMLLFRSVRHILFSPTSAQRWQTFRKAETPLNCLEFQLTVGLRIYFRKNMVSQFIRNVELGPERWPSCKEQWLLYQRSLVQVLPLNCLLLQLHGIQCPLS